VSGLAGILLAAGSARRFGANKLLATASDSVAVAARAARNLCAVLPDAVAIVRPGDVPLSQCLSGTGIAICECADADRGMGASLACGVAARHEADGWLVALADMPFVRPETIAAIVGAMLGGAEIVVPRHEGQRGHPVGFSRDFRNALLALDADAGGRQIISNNETRVTWLDVDDSGIARDIDTVADLMASRR